MDGKIRGVSHLESALRDSVSKVMEAGCRAVIIIGFDGNLNIKSKSRDERAAKFCENVVAKIQELKP